MTGTVPLFKFFTKSYRNHSVKERTLEVSLVDLNYLRDKANNLLKEQVEIANKIDSNLSDAEIQDKYQAKKLNNGMKIIIYEQMPKLKIYDRVVYKKEGLDRSSYQLSRNRWFSMIKQAISNFSENHHLNHDASIIGVINYTNYLSDTDNFCFKFIIDALRYLKIIKHDDNLYCSKFFSYSKQVPKCQVRTEIYILEDTGQLDEIVINSEK